MTRVEGVATIFGGEMCPFVAMQRLPLSSSSCLGKSNLKIGEIEIFY